MFLLVRKIIMDMIFKMPSGFEDVKETPKKELLLFILYFLFIIHFFIGSEVHYTLFY